jgi:hypothetical protein
VAFTEECDENPSCALYRPSIELLNIDKKSLEVIEEFLKKMSGYSVNYKGSSVPGFTIADIFETIITSHLSVGAYLQQLANSLYFAIYNNDVGFFTSMSHRPAMLKSMESYFTSYCPDQAAEKKSLNQWFYPHSKNNIAPIHLVW